MTTTWPRRLLLGALAVLVVVAAVGVWTAVVQRTEAGERRALERRCDGFRMGALARAEAETGPVDGAPVVVIGDSWSVGLGLDPRTDSWPSHLAGRVRVEGFSGSGFSAGASPCRGVSYAQRAAALRSSLDDLSRDSSQRRVVTVVVQGGLNDADQPTAAVSDGFEGLMRELAGRDVVVVGPADAPARAAGVPRVDALLARLAAAYAVPYLSSRGVELDYLGDRLHLTPAGHAAYGEWVADHLPEPRVPVLPAQ